MALRLLVLARLGAVDGHRAETHNPRLTRQADIFKEQVPEVPEMMPAELADRPVAGERAAAEHAEVDILVQPARNGARRQVGDSHSLRAREANQSIP